MHCLLLLRCCNSRLNLRERSSRIVTALTLISASFACSSALMLATLSSNGSLPASPLMASEKRSCETRSTRDEMHRRPAGNLISPHEAIGFQFSAL
jgi:hypothetical protein